MDIKLTVYWNYKENIMKKDNGSDSEKVKIVQSGRNVFAFIVGLSVIAFALVNSAKQIDTGERGVRTWWGEITSKEPLSEGLYFFVPIAGNIVEYDCKTQLYNDTFSTYTKDMQTANINIAINYSLDASGVVDLHRKIGTLYEQKVLYPAISAGIKDIIGKWDAASLVENRDVASKQILDNLVEELNGKHIILESVSIRNIDYSDTFERSIEAKVVAKQKAEEAKNLTVEVQEEAKQKVLSAEAEAKSMQIRAEALNQNKNLVSYEAVQKWDGKLPVNIYGAAPIPFININKD